MVEGRKLIEIPEQNGRRWRYDGKLKANGALCVCVFAWESKIGKTDAGVLVRWKGARTLVYSFGQIAKINSKIQRGCGGEGGRSTYPSGRSGWLAPVLPKHLSSSGNSRKEEAKSVVDRVCDEFRMCVCGEAWWNGCN